MASRPPSTTSSRPSSRDGPQPAEQRVSIFIENGDWAYKRLIKNVKEKPIIPVPITPAAQTATEAPAVEESAKDLHPRRDPTIKHHLLDEYDSWNEFWLDTGIAKNEATLMTLPEALGRGDAVEGRFRWVLRGGEVVDGRVEGALRERHEELVTQLAFTREAIGKLERRGRKVARRKGKAEEKARGKAKEAEEERQRVEKEKREGEEKERVEVARRKAEGGRERAAASAVGVNGEEATAHFLTATAGTMSVAKLSSGLKPSSRSKEGSVVDSPVDLTMSSTPSQDGLQDAATGKTTTRPGNSNAVQITSQMYLDGIIKQLQEESNSTTGHPEKTEDLLTKRKLDEAPISPSNNASRDTDHNTAIGDNENGATVKKAKKVKKDRSMKRSKEEAPDTEKQALNERRRNALKAILAIP